MIGMLTVGSNKKFHVREKDVLVSSLLSWFFLLVFSVKLVHVPFQAKTQEADDVFWLFFFLGGGVGEGIFFP